MAAAFWGTVELIYRPAHLLRRITQILGSLKSREFARGLIEDVAAGFDVGAFESDDEGDLESDLFGGVDDAGGDDGAVHDAAEDVDHDAFDAVVGEDDPEGLGDGFFGG